jgi:hypothetical protein
MAAEAGAARVPGNSREFRVRTSTCENVDHEGREGYRNVQLIDSREHCEHDVSP